MAHCPNYHSMVNDCSFPFPHFITSLPKSSSINESICGVSSPCWKSVAWGLHVERDNVHFHKAWHLQPCYKLQWCQCQEKKLACGVVSSWPQHPKSFIAIHWKQSGKELHIPEITVSLSPWDHSKVVPHT